MAGIKQIYRSPDAFRLPVWDEAVSYSVNSIVAHYDSDQSMWRHYISIQQTTAGSLDSDIAFDEWVNVSFDSDTIYKIATRVMKDNLSLLTDNVDSDFRVTLAQLDSDNDSDFRILQANVDSDISFLRKHIDSEILKFRTEVSSDFDSDVNNLTNIVNNYVAEIQFGRVYDSETILTETVDSRLVNTAIHLTNAKNIIGDYLDQVQESTPITWQAATSSVKDFASNLFQNKNGAHKIESGIDSETLITNFSIGAYVGALSYTGVESKLGGGYFTSAYVKWGYSDGTFYEEDNRTIALDNTTRVQLFNPFVNKKVNTIKITAYERSNEEPGINYIQITSAFAAPELRATRANLLHFQTTIDMLRYKPHPDTIAIVHATDSMFHSEDSEWRSTDPRYAFVDTTETMLNNNFPAAALIDNSRALTTTNGYEYVVKSGSWVLDTTSVSGYDSDRVEALDKTVTQLYSQHNTLNTTYYVDREMIDDRIEQNDSEIIRLSKALNAFYVDYVKLKMEHLDHDSDFVVDRAKHLADLESYKALINSDVSSLLDIDSDKYQQFITTQNNNYSNFVSGTVNAIYLLKEDQDSDNEVILQQILATSLDISLLRNGQVADNDSDIGVLRLDVNNNDSDIAYIKSIAMKFRGLVDVADSDQVPAERKQGEVWYVTSNAYAVEGWDNLRDEYIKGGSMVMFTDAYGWTVINTVSNTTNTEANGVPAGTILTFPSYSAVPSSFRVCDGSVFDPGLYSELYGILGTNTVPDLRGYFLRAASIDNTIDPDGPRNPLSVQLDAFKSHNHTYSDVYPNSPDGVLDGSTDDAVDGNLVRTGTTSTVGGDETRPKNVAVVYAIAMYSGAGLALAGDSDIRHTISEHDSDIEVLRIDVDNNDSDIAQLFHDYLEADSDFKIREDDQDSDISVLQVKVNTLQGTFNLAQFSESYFNAIEGNMVANVEYDITSYVVNTATPELDCYPDLQFFYATKGTAVNPTSAGRRLDGTNGLPQLSYRILHDVVGNMTVSMFSNQNISHDIQIVSTFRIQ